MLHSLEVTEALKMRGCGTLVPTLGDGHANIHDGKDANVHVGGDRDWMQLED